ncbi:cyclin-dependent kinase 2-interacting protein-like isoform X1 [Bufo gargarizans]|uniref:cyclin-dependent kinase 2-interacting protein isoform X1 n=2 Tax=Bufo gargarizans TaxID=30331 RepID=UPI001CF12D37|nr:cyclin-dependent kinase 2-interacting protein isoform X1 [Bufo gargarizans]XP_044128171.1 cyclin-dependent kinase 2-interacting protein isoform X1 [Bufo gargarizans]XP_044128308.1 cyclin-dependent kinase 2-interacting protein-like isoform X1 [Bufo gargarizans]
MESKTSVTPKKSALTGSARKIKDNAADWHNLMLRWESCNDTAFSAASKIVNLKISALSYEKMLSDGAEPAHENPGKDKEELERLCSELLEVLEKMQQLQQKMEKLTSTFKGVWDLEAYQCSGGTPKPILFHTWPTMLFYETSLKMSEMYKKEICLKKTIVGEIAHTAEQDLLMVYLSCWLYQPYVESSIKVLLESMLLETGHRPL